MIIITLKAPCRRIASFLRIELAMRRILHALLSYKDETLLETARWELNVRKIPEKHR